jgi:predicted DNA-binding protein YlxM (UPF0122 family)
MVYPELDELFNYLTEKDKYRLVCRYVLGFSTKQIADIQKVSPQAVTITFAKTERRLHKIKTHDELMELIIRLFDHTCL